MNLATSWSPRVVGALDLGSNSFHLQIATLEADGALRLGPAHRAAVRLGALQDGAIPPEAARTADEALGDLVRTARAAGCGALLAAGTAAFRDAHNGAALARRLGATHGLDLQVLSGQDEARLIFLGTWSRAGRPGERLLVIDLGGRSTELAIGGAGGLDLGLSLPLGHLRAAEAGSDPAAWAQEALAPHTAALRATGWDRVVCTAGTALTLVHMAASARAGQALPSRDGLWAPVPALRALLGQVQATPPGARAALLGWDPRREGTLELGASALLALLEALGVPEVWTAEAALREGLLERWRRAQPEADAAPAPG